MTSRIEPIETRYAGCRFRSRLEARWAVFFDHLGIEWQYEPQGFRLGDKLYLPDFRLPELGFWIEVKGPERQGFDLWFEFALAQADRCLLAGAVPRSSTDRSGAMEVAGDDHYFWTRCPSCGQIGAEFEGDTHRLPCTCPRQGSRDWRAAVGPADEVLDRAFSAARSARFEHGQHGAER